jgi:hypothetical protein
MAARLLVLLGFAKLDRFRVRVDETQYWQANLFRVLKLALGVADPFGIK